jgi:hypothetical protein
MTVVGLENYISTGNWHAAKVLIRLIGIPLEISSGNLLVKKKNKAKSC